MQHLHRFISWLATIHTAYAACSSIGGSDSFTGSFRLVAVNAAAETLYLLTLANSLTVPMTSFFILSASGGSNGGFTSLTMTGGIISSQSSTPNLEPIHSLGPVTINPQNPVASAGPWLTWSNTFAPPSEVFCAVPGDTPGDAPLLAVNGRTDLFSLCESVLAPGTAQEFNALLFNADPTFEPDNTPAYFGSTCAPVTVGLVAVLS